MTKEKLDLIKNISKFLSFFDLSLEIKDNYDLANDLFYYGKLPVLNKEHLKIVGFINKKDDMYIANINDLNMVFNIICDDKKHNKFEFQVKKDDAYVNGYVKFKGKNNSYDGLYEISKDKKQVNKVKFSTYGSYINLYDYINKEYVKLYVFKDDNKNHNILFSHNREDFGLSVQYDFKNIYYSLRKIVEKTKYDDDVIIDNKFIDGGYPFIASDLDVSLREILNVFQDYDTDIFDFIGKMKDNLNFFSDGLYEKLFEDVLSIFNKKSKSKVFLFNRM